MSDKKRIEVINKANHIVVMTTRNPMFRMEWERKGAKKPVPYEVLESAIYDPGVEYLFKQGILYIEDMQTKIDLGLEPEGATEPENIKILEDDEKERYIMQMSIDEFKEAVAELSREQVVELFDYAVANELNVAFNKNKFFKSKYGLDMISAIRLKQLDEEDTDEK